MEKVIPRDERKRTIGLIFLVGSAFVAAAFSLFFGAVSFFSSIENQRAQSRTSLYHNTLIGALRRFEHLPFILARDPYVIAGASGKDLPGLNERLADFAQSANLDAIYLMDKSGLTISASNHDMDVTFLEHNYGFRPYFKDAMAGNRGEFFGIGATTSKPGYFIAEQVVNSSGEVLGVIALKLDLSDLAQAWTEGGETVFVSNADGVVVLSSDLSWRYKALRPISEDRQRAIVSERQFGGELLKPLEWQQTQLDRAELNGENYIYASAPVFPLGWTLHFLANENRVWERAWLVLVGAVIIALGLLILAVYLRAERIRTALTKSQADRRLLQSTNAELALEIEERRAAELKLEKAQTDLARSSKLAALGQLSASVTHELGQPITAMQNYLAAAEFDENTDDRNNTMRRLEGIARRMVSITQQLRFFARPGKSKMEQVDLILVWEGARRMLAVDLENEDIELSVQVDEAPVWVMGNRLRLEQVLINMLRNAISAMAEIHSKRLKVTVKKQEKQCLIIVCDNGHGIGDKTIDQLKEPFLTGEESGRGMGLGLAISSAIVIEHEGKISGSNNEDAGATFVLELPMVELGHD